MEYENKLITTILFVFIENTSFLANTFIIHFFAKENSFTKYCNLLRVSIIISNVKNNYLRKFHRLEDLHPAEQSNKQHGLNGLRSLIDSLITVQILLIFKRYFLYYTFVIFTIRRLVQFTVLCSVFCLAQSHQMNTRWLYQTQLKT